MLAHDGTLEPVISGFFQGRLGDVRDAMRRCLEPALARARLPASSAATPAPFVVRVRIGFHGDLAMARLTRGEVRARLAQRAQAPSRSR